MMTYKKIGFIGCGNMGGALIKAATKTVNPSDIYISDKNTDKVSEMVNGLGVNKSDSISIANECDVIFLGVKPQMLNDMLSEIKDALALRKSRFVLVSMAAGTPISKIVEYCGDYPIIRIMPNLAVSVGEGMIMYCLKDVSGEEENGFCDLMAKSGKLVKIDEKLIDAGSAVSGCGPAYAFMFAEALADGGVYCGLPRDVSNVLAAQTLLGAAKMLLESNAHPGKLKDAVCSPGGTTIAGVLELENGGFRANASNAVIAAYEKTNKL